MNQFEKWIYENIYHALLKIPKHISLDIYALSFYHWYDSDDPRTPILSVSYNTNNRWQKCTPAENQQPRWTIASDSDEAKWNFAFWLQDDGFIAEFGMDAEGELRSKEWIQSIGFWYSDEEENDNFQYTLELDEKIDFHFRQICVNVAKRLHQSGIILDKFNKQLPIIVHQLEYYDLIKYETEAANPPGVADEFCKWLDYR